MQPLGGLSPYQFGICGYGFAPLPRDALRCGDFLPAVAVNQDAGGLNADYGGQLQGGLRQQVRYGLPVFGGDARVFVHGFPFLVLTK